MSSSARRGTGFLLILLVISILLYSPPAFTGENSPTSIKELRRLLDAELEEVDKLYKEKEKRLHRAYKRAMKELNSAGLSPSEHDRKSREIINRYKERKSALYNEWEKERQYWLGEKKRLSRAEDEAARVIKEKLRELEEKKRSEIDDMLESFRPQREEATKKRDAAALKRILEKQTKRLQEIEEKYQRLSAKWKGRKEALTLEIFKNGAPEKTASLIGPGLKEEGFSPVPEKGHIKPEVSTPVVEKNIPLTPEKVKEPTVSAEKEPRPTLKEEVRRGAPAGRIEPQVDLAIVGIGVSGRVVEVKIKNNGRVPAKASLFVTISSPRMATDRLIHTIGFGDTMVNIPEIGAGRTVSIYPFKNRILPGGFYRIVAVLMRGNNLFIDANTANNLALGSLKLEPAVFRVRATLKYLRPNHNYDSGIKGDHAEIKVGLSATNGNRTSAEVKYLGEVVTGTTKGVNLSTEIDVEDGDPLVIGVMAVDCDGNRLVDSLINYWVEPLAKLIKAHIAQRLGLGYGVVFSDRFDEDIEGFVERSARMMANSIFGGGRRDCPTGDLASGNPDYMGGVTLFLEPEDLWSATREGGTGTLTLKDNSRGGSGNPRDGVYRVEVELRWHTLTR